jgi:DNA repair exonuclease SbcCD ATPase subunit
MIIFKNIRWKNFISTGNTYTEVDFVKHNTVLIVGENGAGKSTILDALTFALYGKPFRKINKNQLINSINQKGAMVEVEFQIGRNEYLVRRGIKPNIMEQILKLNHRSFSQIVILGSASFVPFMQLSAAHRREIIEDILDIEIFTVMNTLLKDKISHNKIKLSDVDFQMRSAAEKIEMYKRHIESLKQNNDDLIKQKREKIAQLQLSVSSSNTKVQELTASVQEAALSIADHEKVKKKLEKIADLFRQMELRVSKLNKEIEFFQNHDNCPTCKQGIGTDHKHDIVDTDNKKLEEVEQGKILIQQELQQLNARLAEISNINANIASINGQISEHNVQVSTWNKFIQDIEQEIVDLSNNTTHIDSNNKEMADLKQQLKQAVAEKEELVKEKQTQDIAALLLKDSGIKTKIIRQYVPIINKLINKYLAAMDFFVNFELDESFNETIKSRFRDEFSYESFSEGEKMRIDLALLFTWRAVAKLRNSASTNLLIMDEVFDSSLDSNGTDEFLKILQNITSDTNTFIISHKGDQLFEKFEHVIKFEKHKNFSRIAQ